LWRKGYCGGEDKRGSMRERPTIGGVENKKECDSWRSDTAKRGKAIQSKANQRHLADTNAESEGTPFVAAAVKLGATVGEGAHVMHC